MFNKLAGLLGGAAKPGPPAPPPPPTHPYEEVYAPLFCDDLERFRPSTPGHAADWQSILFAKEPDVEKIRSLSEDGVTESRVRALAYNWLRVHGLQPPKGIVLGVVFDVPLSDGLDVLAVYADGSVRYINQSGKFAVVEPKASTDINQAAVEIVELAKPLVDQIGPWDRPRLAPPPRPKVRISFVVSDGLYFGEGPFDAMQQDALAGPLLSRGANLLGALADLTAK